MIAILLLTIFLVSSCGECKINSDCTTRKCQLAKCIGKKCEYTMLKNCCGNLEKEEIEDDKPGNKCTCPTDYGKCTGKGKITIRNKEYDAIYLEYLCKDEKCIFSYDESLVTEIPLVTEKQFKYFKLETATTHNKPFDIDKDSFKFRFTLKNDNPVLIYPITLTKIQILGGDILFGEVMLGDEFNEVEDVINIEVPVSYQPEQIEDERRVSFKIEYNYKVQKGEEEQLMRETYEQAFSEKIYFVNPGEEQ